ncbi:MAG: alanine:cation symporter family protein, partial [Clostridia bacterium]|nr:alanine:cation symporter family protein [Clostridia bacterium]
ICGILLGVLVFASLLYGSRRIERITSALMPPLTAVYFLLALTVLVRNAALLPEVIGDIFRSAFAPRAVFGGTVGFTVREGIRYGVMRGIFSNEIYIIGLGHNLSKREVFWSYFYGYGGIQNDNRYDCISPSGFAAPLPCSSRQTP